MNDLDQQLDRWLTDADRHLLTPGKPPAADRIRQRADLRHERRRQKRRAAVAAVAVMGLLIGWRSLIPPPPQIGTPDPVQLLADVERLRSEGRQIDQQLELLRNRRRIHELEFTMQRLAGSDRSVQSTYQLNRDTWQALLQITRSSSGPLPESERWQLELLAVVFPDTAAGAVAHNVLNTNQIPDLTSETIDEL
jgi:hypothetical protein